MFAIYERPLVMYLFTCAVTVQRQPGICDRFIIECIPLALYVELCSYKDEIMFKILLEREPLTSLGYHIEGFKNLCYMHFRQCATVNTTDIRDIACECMQSGQQGVIHCR